MRSHPKLVGNFLSPVLTLRFTSFFKIWHLKVLKLLVFVILEDRDLEIIVELADTLQDVLRAFKSDHDQADHEGHQHEIPIDKVLHHLSIILPSLIIMAPFLSIVVVFFPVFSKILWQISNPSKSNWKHKNYNQSRLDT